MGSKYLILPNPRAWLTSFAKTAPSVTSTFPVNHAGAGLPSTTPRIASYPRLGARRAEDHAAPSFATGFTSPRRGGRRKCARNPGLAPSESPGDGELHEFALKENDGDGADKHQPAANGGGAKGNEGAGEHGKTPLRLPKRHANIRARTPSRVCALAHMAKVGRPPDRRDARIAIRGMSRHPQNSPVTTTFTISSFNRIMAAAMTSIRPRRTVAAVRGIRRNTGTPSRLPRWHACHQNRKSVMALCARTHFKLSAS